MMKCLNTQLSYSVELKFKLNFMKYLRAAQENTFSWVALIFVFIESNFTLSKMFLVGLFAIL